MDTLNLTPPWLHLKRLAMEFGFDQKGHYVETMCVEISARWRLWDRFSPGVGAKSLFECIFVFCSGDRYSCTIVLEPCIMAFPSVVTKHFANKQIVCFAGETDIARWNLNNNKSASQVFGFSSFRLEATLVQTGNGNSDIPTQPRMSKDWCSFVPNYDVLCVPRQYVWMVSVFIQ